MTDFEIFKNSLISSSTDDFDAIYLYIKKKSNIPKIRNCILKLISTDISLTTEDVLQEIRIILLRYETKDCNYSPTSQHIYRAVLEFGDMYNQAKRKGYDKVSYTDDITSCSVSNNQVDPTTKLYVDELLSTLEESDRCLIKLYFYEGHPVRDVAKKTGLHATTVQRRLEKIIKELRLQLD